MKLHLILLFVGILMGVFAQIMMKIGMNKKGAVKLNLRALHRDIFRLYLSLHVFIGVFLYLCSFFMWLYVLSKVDLSYAYPLVSVNFVLVALASRLIFKETVSKMRWLSIAVILMGVVLVTMS